MRRYVILFLFFSIASVGQQHCGYDFTSYIVLRVHEDGKKENIPNLKITLIDSTGNEVRNTSNKYSWKNKDEVLHFSENYKIDNAGNPITKDIATELKWYFPFAKDSYLLSVTNDFPADAMQVKITDPENIFQPLIVQLYAYNMYVLCTTQAQQQAIQFGPRVNKPVDIVVERRK